MNRENNNSGLEGLELLALSKIDEELGTCPDQSDIPTKIEEERSSPRVTKESLIKPFKGRGLIHHAVHVLEQTVTMIGLLLFPRNPIAVVQMPGRYLHPSFS